MRTNKKRLFLIHFQSSVLRSNSDNLWQISLSLLFNMHCNFSFKFVVHAELDDEGFWAPAGHHVSRCTMHTLWFQLSVGKLKRQWKFFLATLCIPKLTTMDWTNMHSDCSQRANKVTQQPRSTSIMWKLQGDINGLHEHKCHAVGWKDFPTGDCNDNKQKRNAVGCKQQVQKQKHLKRKKHKKLTTWHLLKAWPSLFNQLKPAPHSFEQKEKTKALNFKKGHASLWQFVLCMFGTAGSTAMWQACTCNDLPSSALPMECSISALALLRVHPQERCSIPKDDAWVDHDNWSMKSRLRSTNSMGLPVLFQMLHPTRVQS